jgi:hypothetical protein
MAFDTTPFVNITAINAASVEAYVKVNTLNLFDLGVA